jgi:hypothetical protein
MIPSKAGAAFLLADVYKRTVWFLIWASSAAVGAGALKSLLFGLGATSR